MKNLKNITIFVMVLLIGAGALFAGGNQSQSGATAGTVTAYNLPRNETLYFNGLQWGLGSGSQPYVSNACTFSINGQRQVQYETLYTYNLLTGKLEPQIAVGDPAWNGQTLTVQLNRNVKFSDGTPLTSADVVNTFELARKYVINTSGHWDFLTSVTAQGDYTVVLQGKASNFNRLAMMQMISEVSITSKKYWDSKLASGELGTRPSDLIAFPGWDCPGTGPYLMYWNDNEKVVMIRNDNYWGKVIHGGKLPAPKYIVSNVYRTNAIGDEAFKRGEVDMSQQFINGVQNLTSYGIQTYVPQAPYHLPGVMPSIFFNTTKPGLNDPVVRRAIAMVLDYDMIGVNAMAGQTAPKQAHMMVLLPAELALIDLDKLKPYQWTGRDITGANKLLDDAGWARGADGVRAKGGVRLSFRAECPEGWSDWNASLEIVAQSTRDIGIDITTYFPDQPVWTADRENNTFDIIMDSPGGVGISSPWTRARAIMDGSYLPPVGTPNPLGNWGRYNNPAATQLVAQIANESDPAKLKELWTNLNILYLQEMPVAGLMYRPGDFYTVNETVWTGFPKFGDGTNIPPTILINGSGINALYNLKLKK